MRVLVEQHHCAQICQLTPSPSKLTEYMRFSIWLCIFGFPACRRGSSRPGEERVDQRIAIGRREGRSPVCLCMCVQEKHGRVRVAIDFTGKRDKPRSKIVSGSRRRQSAVLVILRESRYQKMSISLIYKVSQPHSADTVSHPWKPLMFKVDVRHATLGPQGKEALCN